MQNRRTARGGGGEVEFLWTLPSVMQFFFRAPLTNPSDGIDNAAQIFRPIQAKVCRPALHIIASICIVLLVTPSRPNLQSKWPRESSGKLAG